MGQLPDDSPVFNQILVKLISPGPASLDFTLRVTDRIGAVTDTTVDSLVANGPVYTP